MLKVKTGAFVIGISKKNTHILQPFFKIPDPQKISGLPDKLEQWVQIDWANEC